MRISPNNNIKLHPNTFCCFCNFCNNENIVYFHLVACILHYRLPGSFSTSHRKRIKANIAWYMRIWNGVPYALCTEGHGISVFDSWQYTDNSTRQIWLICMAIRIENWSFSFAFLWKPLFRVSVCVCVCA